MVLKVSEAEHNFVAAETANRLRMIAKVMVTGDTSHYPDHDCLRDKDRPAAWVIRAAELLERQLRTAGFRQCVRCKVLRPPTGTVKDRFGREAGFYKDDATCAECRRELAPTYPSAHLRSHGL